MHATENPRVMQLFPPTSIIFSIYQEKHIFEIIKGIDQ
jgi:hypothetical protein